MTDKLTWQGIEWQLDDPDGEAEYVLIKKNLSLEEEALAQRLVDAGIILQKRIVRGGE